jgi:dihydroorotase
MGVSTVGPSGIEPMKRARDAAERCAMPIMVHIATAPPAIADVLQLMRSGDILTHCFTGQSMKIVDDKGVPIEAIRKAIDKGIILDIGHGAGSFTYKTAEAALAAGLKPHVVSTDIHLLSIEGPMFDMPTCLSKLLVLGYSLGTAIELATAAPARILALEGRGTLRPGAFADIALFHLLSGEFPLYDNVNEVRTGKELLVNAQTFVGGRAMVRRPAPSRPDWFEAWSNAGTVNHIIDFQRELATRGHGPAALARACGCHALGGK